MPLRRARPLILETSSQHFTPRVPVQLACLKGWNGICREFVTLLAGGAACGRWLRKRVSLPPPKLKTQYRAFVPCDGSLHLPGGVEGPINDNSLFHSPDSNR